MQTGKCIDLSMERKCLRREGGPSYIDFPLGLCCSGCLSCNSSVGSVSHRVYCPDILRNVVWL